MVSSFLPSLVRAAHSVPPTALIVPLSGPSAALGRSMERAALMAQAGMAKALFVLDDGGTPAGAAAAARQALKRGAGMILGPLFAGGVRPVVDAVGERIPVVTFSNDAALIDGGAFLLGITAEQAVAPLLRYARARGVRTMGIARELNPWGRQVTAAATRAAEREGLSLADAHAAPDALLFASAKEALVPGARSEGVQALVAFAGLDPVPATVAALDGAWLSAPDPARFADFATAFEAANGSPPGIIAGLAHDAGAIAATLTRGGGTDRSALLAAPLFKGVCGDVHFRADGSASRGMAILAVEAGRYAVVQQADG